jgi:survival motor neuron protein
MFIIFIFFKDTSFIFPPPPPPPDSIKNLPKTEREALTSMLMSYYMSGFHTGLFYQYVLIFNLNL